MAKPNFDIAGSLDGLFNDATTAALIKESLYKEIPIEKLTPFVENFYKIGGSAEEQEYERLHVLDIKGSIELKGLLNPLTVCENKAVDGEYIILSGNTRHEACKLLVAEGNTKYKRVPCNVVFPKNEDDMLLFVIHGNKQRVKSQRVLFEEYDRTKAIYERMKAQGYVVGTLRNVVADKLGISTGQSAKIELIKNNLIDEGQEQVRAGNWGLGTAEVVAKLDPAVQKKVIRNTPNINNVPLGELKKIAEGAAKKAIKDAPKPKEDEGENSYIINSNDLSALEAAWDEVSEIASAGKVYTDAKKYEKAIAAIASAKKAMIAAKKTLLK